MNLSIILAIAFAAISGAASAPSPGPFAPVIAAVRSGAPVSSPARAAEDSGAPRLRAQRRAETVYRGGVVETPLTGAASPRAPAVTC